MFPVSDKDFVRPGNIWKPQAEGDELYALYIGNRRQIKFGEVFDVIDVETGEVVSVPVTTVLNTKLGGRNINVGDGIYLKFKGIMEGKNGNYKDFDIAIIPRKDERLWEYQDKYRDILAQYDAYWEAKGEG